MRNYQNFIGGEWVAAASGKRYSNMNPADTRETVADYPLSGSQEAQEAIAAAQNAFPGWARQTSVARGRVLSKASQVLESRKAELAELLTREEGKTLAESAGEVQRAVDIFRFFGGLSYTIGGQTIPHDLPGNLLYTVRQPLGAARQQGQRRRDDGVRRRIEPQPLRQHQPQHGARLGIVGQDLLRGAVDQRVDVGQPAQRLGRDRAGQRAVGIGAHVLQGIVGRLVERLAAPQHRIEQAQRRRARG